jgi:hypothetical protein
MYYASSSLLFSYYLTRRADRNGWHEVILWLLLRGRRRATHAHQLSQFLSACVREPRSERARCYYVLLVQLGDQSRRNEDSTAATVFTQRHIAEAARMHASSSSFFLS